MTYLGSTKLKLVRIISISVFMFISSLFIACSSDSNKTLNNTSSISQNSTIQQSMTMDSESTTILSVEQITAQSSELETTQMQYDMQPETITFAKQTTPYLDANTYHYVVNTKTHKFHLPSCSYLPTTNRMDVDSTRDDLISDGYSPCKKCNP